MSLIALKHRGSVLLFLSFVLILTTFAPKGQSNWVPIGPFGGDVRTLAADPTDPNRMYLGTRSGQVYLSRDGGKLWVRLTDLQAPVDGVVDNILIDPADTRIVYAGMWTINGHGGGIYKSVDGGLTWKELGGMAGESVRAVAMAPSNSRILVAGSLTGVFRSDDAGATWRRISPAGHPDIRNIDSVAIDPNRPEIIYTGTWHLPWKTTDGGVHWTSIKKGIPDDSDVFRIVIDKTNSENMYATACSGIYRSQSAGAAWTKLKGIPYSSRRTLSTAMDPAKPLSVYAGTNEGLWHTNDAGESWRRLTHHTWVINTILIDPRDSNHFYIGLEGFGVMETRDAGSSFQSANRGFAQRLVSQIIPDPAAKGRFYAALVEDGQFGGVVMAENNGATWEQVGSGLDKRDVSSLLVISSPSWKLLAGTRDGIVEYSPEQFSWQSKSQIVSQQPSGTTSMPGVKVWNLYRRNETEPIYAATTSGLLQSRDGQSWSRVAVDASLGNVSAVTTAGDTGNIILINTAKGLKISRDAGRSWSAVLLDDDKELRVEKIASHPAMPGTLFAGAAKGLFRSTDGGVTWEKFGHGLPVSAIRDITINLDDPKHMVVAGSAGLFESHDGGDQYSRLAEAAGMEGLPIQHLALHPSAKFPILAASPSNGFFRFDNGQPSVAASAVITGVNQSELDAKSVDAAKDRLSP